jgi:hypothetical protein
LQKIAEGKSLTRDEREIVEREMDALTLPAELAEAAVDDEPETPEEAAAVAEARESVTRGVLIPLGELRRTLGA